MIMCEHCSSHCLGIFSSHAWFIGPSIKANPPLTRPTNWPIVTSQFQRNLLHWWPTQRIYIKIVPIRSNSTTNFTGDQRKTGAWTLNEPFESSTDNTHEAIYTWYAASFPVCAMVANIHHCWRHTRGAEDANQSINDRKWTNNVGYIATCVTTEVLSCTIFAWIYVTSQLKSHHGHCPWRYPWTPHISAKRWTANSVHTRSSAIHSEAIRLSPVNLHQSCRYIVFRPTTSCSSTAQSYTGQHHASIPTEMLSCGWSHYISGLHRRSHSIYIVQLYSKYCSDSLRLFVFEIYWLKVLKAACWYTFGVKLLVGDSVYIVHLLDSYMFSSLLFGLFTGILDYTIYVHAQLFVTLFVGSWDLRSNRDDSSATLMSPTNHYNIKLYVFLMTKLIIGD